MRTWSIHFKGYNAFFQGNAILADKRNDVTQMWLSNYELNKTKHVGKNQLRTSGISSVVTAAASGTPPLVTVNAILGDTLPGP